MNQIKCCAAALSGCWAGPMHRRSRSCRSKEQLCPRCCTWRRERGSGSLWSVIFVGRENSWSFKCLRGNTIFLSANDLTGVVVHVLLLISRGARLSAESWPLPAQPVLRERRPWRNAGWYEASLHRQLQAWLEKFHIPGKMKIGDTPSQKQPPMRG